MKIKHKCKKCAERSKWYAEWSKRFAEGSKWYAEESKRYAEKCRCKK